MSLGAALSGIARGVGNVYARKQQQEYDDKQRQTKFLTDLVSNAVASGNVDPQEAFTWMMGQTGGGKGKGAKGKGGGDLPPAIQTLIQHAQTTYGAGASPGTPQPSGQSIGDVPVQAGLPAAPPSTPQPSPDQTTTVGGMHFKSNSQLADEAARRKNDADLSFQTQNRDAEVKAREGIADRLKLTGLQRNEYIATGKWPTQYAPRSISTKLPASALPDDALDIDGRPITPKADATYTVREIGQREDGSPDVRYVENAVAPKAAPKSTNMNAIFAELKADPKNAGKSDTDLWGLAARQAQAQRSEVATERRARFDQYMKLSAQTLLKDGVALAYMKENQPLLLEAKRLGIQLSKSKTAAADELAKKLAAHPESSVQGEDPRSIVEKLVEEGMPRDNSAAATPAARPPVTEKKKADPSMVGKTVTTKKGEKVKITGIDAQGNYVTVPAATSGR